MKARRAAATADSTSRGEPAAKLYSSCPSLGLDLCSTAAPSPASDLPPTTLSIWMRRAAALATQSTWPLASALSKLFLRLVRHVLLKHLDEVTVRIAEVGGRRGATREMDQSAMETDSGCLEACVQPGDVLNVDRKMADTLI